MAGGRIGSVIAGPSEEPFELVEYLGQGNFGEVYLAVGRTSGRAVAAKLLLGDELERPEVLTALMNEAQLATEVRHPNVVQVVHVAPGFDGRLGPYIMMEYLPGGNLRRLLRAQQAAGSQIGMGRALEMMIDIAQGARAINERLIHRDIKPDNILLDDGRLKIGDFGISKIIDERTRAQTFKGGQHVRYMAPEGWELDTNTFKLDVYSVGLVFYEILTLQHPFQNLVSDLVDWRAWRNAHLFTACPDVRSQRPDVNLGLAQLLQRMVGKRPQDRPSWDEILGVLASSNNAAPSNNVASQPPRIDKVVEAALERHQEINAAELAAAKTSEETARKAEVYRYSCERLVEIFDKAVDDFNSRYQHGSIRIEPGIHADRTYRLPMGGTIVCRFFSQCETDISLEGGRLVGGGYLGVPDGFSSNLLLLREGDDDLYGRWVGCLVAVMAFEDDPLALLRAHGLSGQQVSPFGFRDAKNFYEQIRYIRSGLHVFSYEIRTDVQQIFMDILEIAFRKPPVG